jgi:hypothetical protein
MQNRTFLFTLFLSALLTLGFIVLLPMIPGARALQTETGSAASAAGQPDLCRLWLQQSF